jgi:hypothetical protein
VIRELRIGLNAVSERVKQTVFAAVGAVPVPCHIYEEATGRNVYKYPLMRRMFHDKDNPMRGESVMWFDDDSYVTSCQQWWRDVALIAGDLIGSKYYYQSGFTVSQQSGIRVQPWYTGKPFIIGPHHSRPTFVTGGWWILKAEIIKKWEWPILDLKHNGGDTILSELCNQQGYKITHFNKGVAINADELGNESKASRRGETTTLPWTELYRDVAHHEFTHVLHSFYKAAFSE